MSTTLKNIKIPYPTEGVIRSSQLNDTVCPENSVQLAVNMNFDRVGAIQTRPGITQYLSTVPGPDNIRSMAGLVNQVTGARYLFANLTNGKTYAYNVANNVYSVGQVYGGGIIAYILQVGDPGYDASFTKGFIISTVNMPTSKWHATDTGTTGATGTAIGTGQVNTTAIIALYGVESNAAYVCDQYTIAGYNDWYLPSRDELNKIYINKDIIGGINTTSGVYWSSTELSATDAYSQSFSSGFGGNLPKSSNGQVRAIRSFSIPVPGAPAWTLVNDTGAGLPKARFAQYLNRMWMVNGWNPVGGHSALISDGGTFSGGSLPDIKVPAGFPSGDFISAGFEGRIWTGVKATDTLYFTDIVQFTPPGFYSITFDITKNYIQNLSPLDGETMTALKQVPRALLIFKQNHIYRVYGATSMDAYPAYNVGTYSQESIIEAKDGLYFHHSSGFYKFDYGGQPIEISRRVIDFVKAIPRTAYDTISGVWDGFDNVEWSVGPVTVEGVTYTNCVMRYTISTQIWTIYDYTGNVLNSMIRFDTGSAVVSLAGTSTGKVVTLDSGLTDLGAPIYYEMIDRWRCFNDMYSFSKSISGLMVSSENGGGAVLEYQTEKSQPNVYKYIDTIKDKYDALFPNASTIDFNNLRFRLRGNTSGTPMLFHAIEMLSLQIKGLDEN